MSARQSPTSQHERRQLSSKSPKARRRHAASRSPASRRSKPQPHSFRDGDDVNVDATAMPTPASWALPPLLPHQPHSGTTFHQASDDAAGSPNRHRGRLAAHSAGAIEVVKPLRRRGQSASPTRRSQRAGEGGDGGRAATSRSRSRSRSPPRVRAETAIPGPRRPPPRGNRLGYRAAAGHVELTVQQPFFKKSQSKAEARRLRQRKATIRLYKMRSRAAECIQRAVRVFLAKGQLRWRQKNIVFILQRQAQNRERKRREREQARLRAERAAAERRLAAERKAAAEAIAAARRRAEAQRRREEAARQAAARRVQALCRGGLARRLVHRIRAARKMQSVVRGRRGRLEAEARREAERAATRINNAGRARLAKRRAAEARRVRDKRKHAGTVMNSLARAFFAKRRTAVMRQKAREERAATTITSLGRAKAARRRAEAVRQKAKEERAATTITNLGRAKAAKRRAESARQKVKEERAATAINNLGRAKAARRKAAELRKDAHVRAEARALHRAVQRARDNFDHEALRAFIDQAVERGIPVDHEAVVAAEAFFDELVAQHEAVLKVQRVVRGKLARLELEMLKMQLEAAVLLQGFLRMKHAQKLRVTKKSAIEKLQRSIRGMISRKIFAEGMEILNEKLAHAMGKLEAMLNSHDGLALVRQHLLIRNALPTPKELKAGARQPVIADVSQGFDVVVKRDSPSARLGAGFDKLAGMSSSSYKALVARLTITKISPGTPMAISELEVGDIVLNIDGERIESVQDLVGQVNGKKKMTFRVVRTLREPTLAELEDTVALVKAEFRRDSEKRIVEVQKKGLVIELFGRPFGPPPSDSAVGSGASNPAQTPRERVLSNLTENDLPGADLASPEQLVEAPARAGSGGGGGGRGGTAGQVAKKGPSKWQIIVKKRWHKIKLLAMSLAGFRGGSPKVSLQLSPGKGRRKAPVGEDVAQADMHAAELHNAVYDGDAASLRRMLDEQDLDPDLVESGDDTNYTMLLTCVSIADEEEPEESLAIARLLLEHGANVNHVAADGSTPLILAAYQNNPEMLEVLLEVAGNRINFAQTIQNGATALYLACQDGHTEVVRMMLQRASVRELLRTRTDAGCTPLFIAVHVGFDDMVEAICSAVSEHEGAAAVKKLIAESGLDTDLLSLAIQRCRFAIASTLVRFGARIDTRVADGELAAESQPLQVCVCTGAPPQLLQELLLTSQAAIEILPADQPKEREARTANLRAFAVNAAKTAAFMLELELLQVLGGSGLVDVGEDSTIARIFSDVHKTPLAAAQLARRQAAKAEAAGGDTAGVLPGAAKRANTQRALEKEMKHLRTNGHDFVTAKELGLVLTKVGFSLHYDDHFDEYRELVLFRMASRCYVCDQEQGLKDVGDMVEDDAVPIEGFNRVVPYLARVSAAFASGAAAATADGAAK